jgi:hypothetical protein
MLWHRSIVRANVARLPDHDACRPGNALQRQTSSHVDSRRRLLVSLTCPILLLGLLDSTVCSSAVASGLSRSQQKAYDAFTQLDLPPVRETPEMLRTQREKEVMASSQREKSRIQTALRIFSTAESDQKEGRYADALVGYESVITNYPDLALAERARVSRALMEYQMNKVSMAILHLKDEEIALRGDAEVHCALAAILYSERPYELNFAEEQYDVAMEFDTRYGSIDFVRDARHWPPRLVAALEKFLSLGGG